MMASRRGGALVKKRDRPGVGAEVVVGEGRHLAVPAVDGRSDDPVVVQRSDVGPRPYRVHSEDGVPRRVDRLVGLEADLGGIETLRGQQVRIDHEGQAARQQHQEQRHRDRSGASHDDHRRQQEDGRRQHDGGGWPDGVGQVDHQGTGQPGTDQIGEIEAAHRFGPTAEERGDDDARCHERDEEEEADGEQLPHALGRGERAVVPDGQRVERDVGHHDIARDDAQGTEEQAPQQDRVGPGLAQPARDSHHDPPGADPEERQADDEVGVVVEEFVGDDRVVADLDEQGRKAHEQDLGVVSLALLPAYRNRAEPARPAWFGA